MTNTAIFNGMNTRQGKLCHGMVIFYLSPPGSVMTGRTVSSGIKFWIDKTFVNVFMTIHANVANLPEAPFIRFLVTGKTRRCQVRTFKRERSIVMLSDGKGGLVVTLCAVAFRAIGDHIVNPELSFMEILMTVRAMIVF